MTSVQLATAQAIAARIADSNLNATRLAMPAFVLCPPFSYSAEVANNVWMEDLAAEERRVDVEKAVRQFLELYHFLSSEGLVYLLPAPGDCGLQDLVFAANLGAVLAHLPDKNTVVISNFRSPPRIHEPEVGIAFFRALGYDVRTPPHKFEGEAELKHLHGNVYAGGYGIRSEREAYAWMESEFDMRVVPLKETEPYLYHLDCTVFPLTSEETIVCTEMFTPEEVAALEKHTGIIDASADDCFTGLCNSVRLGNTILNASNIQDLKRGTEDYEAEKSKNRRLEDIATDRAMDVAYFNLSEFQKGGALLSCMVLHLNRNSYEIPLL